MSYLGTRPSNQTPTYRQVYEFTATANQTTFSVPYTVGFVSVFRNGVQLGSANFTATNGTSVVLTSGCNAGDYVRIESLFTANVQGAIPNTTGAVATANIADGAITTAKIANGAVVAADLADGAVTRAKMGYAGAVLQVVRNGAVFPTTTFSSSSYVDSGASVTITPSSSNSRIMLLFRSPRQSYSGGAIAYYRFYRNTTGIGNDPQTQNDLSGERYGYSFSMFFIDSPNTTASITYRIYGRTLSGGNFSWAGDDAYEFIAMEIAG